MKPWLFCLLIFVVGCHKSSPIVGIWQDQTKPTSTVMFEFRPDGTYTEENSGSHGVSIRITGKYRLEGEKLSISEGSVINMWKGSATKMPDGVLQAHLDGDALEILGQNPVTKENMSIAKLTRMK